VILPIIGVGLAGFFIWRAIRSREPEVVPWPAAVPPDSDVALPSPLSLLTEREEDIEPMWTMKAWVAFQVTRTITAAEPLLAEAERGDRRALDLAYATIRDTVEALAQHPDGQPGAMYLSEYLRHYAELAQREAA
jgi:hypothetical protein